MPLIDQMSAAGRTAVRAIAGMSVGLFSDLPTLNIPVGTDLVQTSGYNAVGVGAARYCAVTAGTASAWCVQTANGRWFQLCEVLVTPQMMGVTIGDGVHPDDGGTFENAAFQHFFDYIHLNPVTGFVLPAAVKYWMDHTSIGVRSNHVCEWQDAVFDADLSDLGADPGITVAPYGGMFVAASDDLKRSGTEGTVLNACVLQGQTLGPNIMRNVRWSGHLTIDCTYAGAQLAANHRYEGVDMYFGYNVDMEDLFLEGSGLPNDLMTVGGGNRLKLPTVRAKGCGFLGAENSNRNGFTVVGYLISGNPELSSTDVTVGDVWCEGNHDEGYAMGGPVQLRQRDIVCVGNGDKGLEGISGFLAPTGVSTAPDGQPILFRLQANQIRLDGKKADGSISTGVPFGIQTAAIVEIDVTQMVIENWAPADSFPINIGSSVGGRISLHDIQLKNCTNMNGLYYLQADDITIGDIEGIGCSGSGESAVAGKRVKLGRTRMDGASTAASVFLVGTDADEIDLRDVGSYGGVARSPIVIAYTDHIKVLKIRDSHFPTINTDAAATNGFISFYTEAGTAASSDLTIDCMIVEDNYAPCPAASAYAINTTVLKPGAIKYLRSTRNDFGAPSMGYGVRSFSDGPPVLAYEDWGNNMTGQRRFTIYSDGTDAGNATALAALSTTVGNITRGDIAIVGSPSAGIGYYYVATYTGTWQKFGGDLANP